MVGVLIIGFVHHYKIAKTIKEQVDFLNEYRSKFVKMGNKFIESGYQRTLDHNLYHWFTRNVTTAQTVVGRFGVAGYMAPFQAYKPTNYQYLVNTLPKFRERHSNQSELTNFEDVLVRALGFYEDLYSDANKNLKNPFKWLQFGVRFLIGLPVRLLSWFGIIPEKWVSIFTSNWAFKTISGLIALIGFISSIIGLITGWKEFLAIVRKWI